MQEKTIKKKIESVRRDLADAGPVLKGSISKVVRGPRKRGSGDRIAYQLTYKGDGNITKSVYIPKSQVASVKTMVRNHQRARDNLAKLVELNVLLLKLQNASLTSEP
jgi:hypothetical protein